MPRLNAGNDNRTAQFRRQECEKFSGLTQRKLRATTGKNLMFSG